MSLRLLPLTNGRYQRRPFFPPLRWWADAHSVDHQFGEWGGTYRDYHLIVEYKWGKRTDGGKFVRNSGILLHATGPDGGAGGTWMSSIECQLAQGCVGDLIPIRGKDEAGGRPGADHE